MLIPNKFNGYTAGRRTYNTGMEPLLIGAAIGGVSSAAQGGDPLKGALLGGLTGGIGSGIAGALGGAATSGAASGLTSVGAAAPTASMPSLLSAGASPAASSLATSVGAAIPEAVGGLGSYGLSGLSAGAAPGASGLAALVPEAAASGAVAAPISMGTDVATRSLLNSASLNNPFDSAMLGAAEAANPAATVPSATESALVQAAPDQGVSSLLSDPSTAARLYGKTGFIEPAFGAPTGKASFMDSPTQWWKSLSPKEKLLYGGGAGLGLMALMGQQGSVPGQAPYTGPLSKFKYDPFKYNPASIPRRAAAGGTMSSGVMARGGIADLGSYSDGGRLLKGPGDGMSDNIPATISNKRPARLADGEFVVPADVVSHLGNGSTDAGAKQLYAMMDKVRSARTGRKAQGKQIKPQKYMPA